MNRDKQIEEMAKDLASSTHSRCIGTSKTCDICDWQEGCLYRGLAKTLNDKGYRKASEVDDWKEIAESYQKMFEDNYEKHQLELAKVKTDVAREIFEQIDDTMELVCAMTGLDIYTFGRFAELKKMYTEGER